MYETAILILTYNGIENTVECLESLKKQIYKDYQVIIVDNASADSTVDTVKSGYPDVFVLENKQNLGYAGGNNAGLAYCIEKNFKYVFIINNDIILEPDALQKMVQFIENYPDAGIIGPINYSYYNRNEVQFLSSKLILDKYEFHVNTELSESCTFYETDYVNGAAMLLRIDLLKEIGCFDENYFLFWEESDLCLRTRRTGYKCIMLTNAKIYHKESASFGTAFLSPLKNYYLQRNKLYFFKKNYNEQVNFIFFFYYLDRVVKKLIKCLFSKPGSFLSLVRSDLLACSDYFGNRMGNRNDFIMKK